MSPMPTISLQQPIGAARVVEAPPARIPQGGCRLDPAAADSPAATCLGQPNNPPGDLREQEAELAWSLEIVNRLADGLQQLHAQTLANHRVEIARLAVEIARRILKHKLAQGDYDIQAIVEEALQQAPSRQNIVVRLHPEDASRCQQLQREDPDSPFAALELAADGSVGRGECLVETPKGIVKSFIEEHLERIREALERCEV